MTVRLLLMSAVFVTGILLSAAIPASAQLSYCFQSADGNNLHLRFNLIDRDWKYGYIQYNKPMYGTFIRQKYNHLIESYNKPGMREYMWEELRNDTVTGTYQFIMQGDSVTDIRYIRTTDKKEFKFTNTNVGIIDCQCDWQE